MTTEPTDAGLLPCPFCGSEEITISTTTHLTFTCLNCSCRLHGKANSAWNTRAASRLSRRPTEPEAGQSMDSAPKDRSILVWAPTREGLPAMFAICKWHPDAGFCIDELREPVMWWDGEWDFDAAGAGAKGMRQQIAKIIREDKMVYRAVSSILALVSPAATRRAALEEVAKWCDKQDRIARAVNDAYRSYELTAAHCRRLAQGEGGE